ncbi:MAG: hypothetical protein AAGJ93_02585 [Bacteroidota bacterium]
MQKSIQLLLLLSVVLSACQSSTHVDTEAVIEEKVQERLAEFKRVIDLRCRDKVMEEAGLIADSLVLLQARLKKDTLQRPVKPLRPDEPELKTLNDSLPLKPLFEPTLSPPKKMKPASKTQR